MNNPSPDAVTIFANIIGIVTPAIVDALKRKTWDSKQVALFALVVTIFLYVTIHALSGTLVYPVPLSFWANLLSVFGTQQLVYLFVYRDRNPEPTTTIETNVIPASGVVVTTTETKEGA